MGYFPTRIIISQSNWNVCGQYKVWENRAEIINLDKELEQDLSICADILQTLKPELTCHKLFDKKGSNDISFSN